MSDFWDDALGGDQDPYQFDYQDIAFTPSYDVCQKKASDWGLRKPLGLDLKAGTRVAFKPSLEALLTYDDVPPSTLKGTVVTVKTGGGTATSFGDRFFVLWDDGKLRNIMAQHLRLASRSKVSNSVRRVVADLGDISSLFSPVASSGGNELVHLATKDLWALRKDGGQYVIERLFDDTGKPLKV